MKSFSLAIAITLSATTFAQSPRLVSLELPASGIEVIQVLIAPPQGLSARELGAWQLICAGLLEGTGDFVKEDLFSYGGQAGFAPEVHWNNELCRIQLVGPKGGGGVIARLTESILTRPLINDESMTKVRSFVGSPSPDDWVALLRGDRGDLTVPMEFVQLTRDRLIRSDTVTICATSGALSSLAGRFRDWQPRRVSSDLRVGRTSPFIGPEVAAVSQWRAKPVLPITSQSAKLLAMVALGGGKTGLLHQVVRDQMGLTYRQEAFLLPTRTGWQPVVQLGGASDLPEAKLMKEELVRACDGWTSGDLSRVKLLAKSAVEGRNPLSPFWVSNRVPYQASELDRTAFEAYAYLWGCERTSLDALKNDLGRVTLAELQEAVKELLAEFQ